MVRRVPLVFVVGLAGMTASAFAAGGPGALHRDAPGDPLRIAQANPPLVGKEATDAVTVPLDPTPVLNGPGGDIGRAIVRKYPMLAEAARRVLKVDTLQAIWELDRTTVPTAAAAQPDSGWVKTGDLHELRRRDFTRINLGGLNSSGSMGRHPELGLLQAEVPGNTRVRRLDSAEENKLLSEILPRFHAAITKRYRWQSKRPGVTNPFERRMRLDEPDRSAAFGSPPGRTDYKRFWLSQESRDFIGQDNPARDFQGFAWKKTYDRAYRYALAMIFAYAEETAQVEEAVKACRLSASDIRDMLALRYSHFHDDDLRLLFYDGPALPLAPYPHREWDGTCHPPAVQKSYACQPFDAPTCGRVNDRVRIYANGLIGLARFAPHLKDTVSGAHAYNSRPENSGMHETAPFNAIYICQKLRGRAAMADLYFWWAGRLRDHARASGSAWHAVMAALAGRKFLADILYIAEQFVHELGHANTNGRHCHEKIDGTRRPLMRCHDVLSRGFELALYARLGLPKPTKRFDHDDADEWLRRTRPSNRYLLGNRDLRTVTQKAQKRFSENDDRTKSGTMEAELTTCGQLAQRVPTNIRFVLKGNCTQEGTADPVALKMRTEWRVGSTEATIVPLGGPQAGPVERTQPQSGLQTGPVRDLYACNQRP